MLLFGFFNPRTVHHRLYLLLLQSNEDFSFMYLRLYHRRFGAVFVHIVIKSQVIIDTMTTTTTTKEYTNIAGVEPTDDVNAAKDKKEAERAGDEFAEKNPSVTTNPSTAKLQPEFAGPKTAHVKETTIEHNQ